MTGRLLCGKPIAEKGIARLKERSRGFEGTPRLATIFIGDNPASETYIRIKERTARRVGAEVEVFRFGSGASAQEVRQLITELNGDENTHGIIVQLPLPGGHDAQGLANLIDPRKDVDCLTHINLGRLMYGGHNSVFKPPTASGVLELIQAAGHQISGKDCTVVGCSVLVGKPVALMLEREGATVTMAHDKTRDLARHTRVADILVVAAGQKWLIGPDMVKKGSTVVDVGINREKGKLYGDVEFPRVKDKAGCITPVPGGVGPLTVSGLFENLFKAYELQSD